MKPLLPWVLMLGSLLAVPKTPIPEDMRTEEAIQRKLDATVEAVKEGRATETELQRVLEEADAALKALDEMKPTEKPVELDRLETINGKVYQTVTVVKVNADSIAIRHEAGSATVPFEILSEEWRKRFGYDPALVEDLRKQAAERARLVAEARKIAAAEKKAAVERRKSEEAIKTKETELEEREAEVARREAELNEKESHAKTDKKVLDEAILKKTPEPGMVYPLPINRAGLSFSQTHGRKFVIPLQLAKYDNLRIRIRHGFDNSRDGGMKWELRQALNGKKLDAGFADEEGDYTVTVRNIPVRQIELVLTDDDTSFTGRDPGNGFKISLSEVD